MFSQLAGNRTHLMVLLSIGLVIYKAVAGEGADGLNVNDLESILKLGIVSGVREGIKGK